MKMCVILLSWVSMLWMISSLGVYPAVSQGSRSLGSTIYVDTQANGNNDGTSWADAFTDLQPALQQATSGDQVWVAAGTYLPTVEHCGAGERFRSFQLKNGVGVYGGFDPSFGNDTWDERDWVKNAAILSGDIGIPGDSTDNSYHVLCHPEGLNLDSSAVLDGFTIRGGQADGNFPDNRGGGMYNSASSPTLTNLSIYNNSAFWGGGLYNYQSSSHIDHVSFSGNSATLWGGGTFDDTSTLRYTHVTFYRNRAVENGGGIYNRESSPILTDVTFNYNSAERGSGGGMFNYGQCAPVLSNVIFSYNRASFRGGGMANGTSTPVLINVSFSGNAAGSGGGIANDGSSAILDNVTFIENIARGGGAMYNTSTSSIALANVTFSANMASDGGAMYNDYSSLNLTNVTFFGNSATFGVGGAMRNVDASVVLKNSILWGDSPDEIYDEWESSSTASYSDIWLSDGSVYPGTGNLNIDPRLSQLAGNGGFVLTHALGLGSHAIDAGNPDPASCPPADARQALRPFDGNGDGLARCDMGAYESQVVSLPAFLPVILK